MRYLIVFVAACCLMLNCSNDDDNAILLPVSQPIIDNFKIENYHAIYAMYDINLQLNYPGYGDNMVRLEYDSLNRIIKRTGNVFYTGSTSGIVHDSLYTDLTYAGNIAYRVKKIRPFGGYSAIDKDSALLTFDVFNRIIQKIQFKEYNYPQIDTTNYVYDINGKLISYINTYNKVYDDGREFRTIKESQLYYTNGNLDSIVTIRSLKPNFVDYTALYSKYSHIFSGYDTAENPFRKLQMFDETFYRSLSNNNFTEYKLITGYYDYPNNNYYAEPIYYGGYESKFQTWDLIYDENGDWIYYEF